METLATRLPTFVQDELTRLILFRSRGDPEAREVLEPLWEQIESVVEALGSGIFVG